MSKYQELGQEIGALVDTKQKSYGDSFGKSGAVMRILYPNGISHDQLDDALTVVRVLDKLFRIATARDALGESPWRDLAGYSLLSVARVEAAKATPPQYVCARCGKKTVITNTSNECMECFADGTNPNKTPPRRNSDESGTAAREFYERQKNAPAMGAEMLEFYKRCAVRDAALEEVAQKLAIDWGPTSPWSPFASPIAERIRKMKSTP